MADEWQDRDQQQERARQDAERAFAESAVQRIRAELNNGMYRFRVESKWDGRHFKVVVQPVFPTIIRTEEELTDFIERHARRDTTRVAPDSRQVTP